MRKMTVVLLAAMFLVLSVGTLFAGGSSQTAPRGGSQNMANLNPVGQLPVVKQKESFTLLVDDNGKPEEKLLYEILEKETNVHVNLMLYPYQAGLERKNILLASGDYPDVIGGWLMSTNDILSLSADGVIIPLEDIIDRYTVNMKAALNLPGIRAAMTLPDGHIYSPPYVIGEPIVTFLPWINSQWMSRLGLRMPSTTEEFKQVLIAFRDRIPPVNGQKIIPFSGDPNNLQLGMLAGWFGVNASGAGNNGGYVAMINGQLESTIIRPEYREFIKYFADLYANGLVDPELFTQDLATWKAKGKLGLYGVSIAYGPGDFATEISDAIKQTPWLRQTHYEALPVLRAPGVTKPLFRRSGFGVTLFRTQMVITDKASNPITILRWLDNLYGVEHSIEADYGPIGVKFERLADGSYREINTTNWPKEQQEKYAWGMTWTTSMPKYRRSEIKVAPPAGQLPNFDENPIAEKLYEPFLEAEPAPPLWLSDADARRASDIQTAIINYVKQKQAEWVSGQASVDAEWSAYLAQLDRLGLQELLRIKRAAIRR